MEDDNDCIKSLSLDPLQEFNAPLNTSIRTLQIASQKVDFAIYLLINIEYEYII